MKFVSIKIILPIEKISQKSLQLAVLFFVIIAAATAKPAVVYNAEIGSPYVFGASSSQYVARNFNGYYVAESPYVSSYSLPLSTADAYSSYVL